MVVNAFTFYYKLPKSMGTGVYLTERSAAWTNITQCQHTLHTLHTPHLCDQAPPEGLAALPGDGEGQTVARPGWYDAHLVMIMI